MSYSTAGYMHCEPFVYWGDLHADWAEYVKNVDVGDFLWKLRYMGEALAYLDKIEFSQNPFYEVGDHHEIDVDWYLSRRGAVSFLSSEEWWEKTVLFPLSRNPFPFVFATREELNRIVEQNGEDAREEITEDLPGPFYNEEELEEYVREHLDTGDEFEKLAIWDLCVRSPNSDTDEEMESKNFDGDGHLGSDAVLDFLAQAGIVNRDLRNWMVSYHLTGEDGEEFCHARKIVGNKVEDPHERRSPW